jgi:Fe-S-cluster containining protein
MHCRPQGDFELIQIVDSAFAGSARKAGKWLICRPGCTQCCIGAFAINALDSARLQSGLEELRRSDPARAARVEKRARAYLARVLESFPGDITTGMLREDGDETFAEFANDEVCPALDPEMGTCDLYAYRPMTCRVFGPPVRNQDGSLGICELCFHGATNEEIAACEMHPDPDGLEDRLNEELTPVAPKGTTIVACALANF